MKSFSSIYSNLLSNGKRLALFSKKLNLYMFWESIYVHIFKRNISNNIKFNYDYLCDPANTLSIKENILRRKSNGDIEKVILLWKELNESSLSSVDRQNIENDLYVETIKIPNKTSPHIYSYNDKPFIVRTVNDKPLFKFKPKAFETLMTDLHIFQMDRHLSLMSGSKSYIFSGELASLERSLIRYTMTALLNKGFQLVSVPNLLNCDIVERCGMQTSGKRSQIYRVNNLKASDICLAGTSEMSFGGYLSNRLFTEDELPLKLMAVSRCFRQEVGRESADKGLYRVHEFTKVEMFVVTGNESEQESQDVYKELIDIQVELFSPLNFYFEVLDMPVIELGAPAYCKTDIEAWIPGRGSMGEISSASNCTDYQSRRLNIKYVDSTGIERFTHTLNGTACAVPRLLMALATSNQTKKGSIIIPEVLRPFMGGTSEITSSEALPRVKHFNQLTFPGKIGLTSDVT